MVIVLLYIPGNKKTGLESDLASKEKKCAMVFVVNVIDVPNGNNRYDMSYGKCFLLGETLKCSCDENSSSRKIPIV